ncbi:MBL fold metallo-hydrolase [Microbacterium kyungheense]|uniref:Glyoxylase-like metal-dependent hydrolase (Beta-lactamase superfamily II) n=1 Tax=Microbacterium kyungheense TaxID=1263636 RepID=A0A543FJA4_9MICO|nr:MBL fold metallo-hydrolase [Microbacterium kyungheense]TQM33796.1 glyoxylase-like metal-dependent hydrolase (beta-lactamase superfamily II) [Microbacterium kyungheense]
MLTEVADGVFVHEAEFVQSNSVIVRGRDGALLIDPGITRAELSSIASDLDDLGLRVVAAFSTHPHWDHLLWDARFGDVPRYGTAGCAASARTQLAPEAKAEIIAHLDGTGIEDDVPMELFGLVSGLPEGAAEVPWDGPRVRIIEHAAHAPGHAALWIEDRSVLVAGDMLSDVLVPMLDFDGTADPFADHLTALGLLEEAAADAAVLVPGHGSVGGPGAVPARVAHDRAYVEALRDGRSPDDARIGPDARAGWEWVADVHAGQVAALSRRREVSD